MVILTSIVVSAIGATFYQSINSDNPDSNNHTRIEPEEQGQDQDQEQSVSTTNLDINNPQPLPVNHNSTTTALPPNTKMNDSSAYLEWSLTEAELERIRNTPEKLLEFVEACSKVAQKSWVFDLKETLRVTRLQGKAEYMLQHVVEQTFQQDPAGHSYQSVTCDFRIKESRLVHDYDLRALKKRVLQLFDWYSDDTIRQQYLAPYFPLIQSSGMGKTKLLYELRQSMTSSEKGERTHHVVLVLCSSGELEGDMMDTYNQAVELEECMKREPDPRLKYRQVELELERVCHYHSGKPTILLFDEAQNLLVGKDNHLFNCIQWWLCKKDKKPQQVVAVFAGTTLQFATMEREPPESDQWGDYWMDGSKRFRPFYQLHTMGCLLQQQQQQQQQLRRSSSTTTTASTNDNTRSEYEESIGYGRPLFAKMGERKLLGDDCHLDIVRRLVLSHVDTWWKRVDSCFSVLATRVQMGQTSFFMASELVSRGYAVLSNLDADQQVAEICHLPDPVCARLAMCLMKEGWRTVVPGLSGRDRSFWVSKMAEIFSNETCIPSAGDVGEVFAALYLLFCGDILRFQLPPVDDLKNKDNDCKNFSVSLTKWIYLIIQGGEEPSDWESEELIAADTINASVCFIQITQNYLRYEESMAAWTQQHFLEHLYKSRSAFYVFEDCSVFDIFASIRYKASDFDPPEYFPLLISIVSLPKFSPSEATSACCAMEMSLTKARCYGGLCILLVLGRTTKTEFDEDLLLTVQDLENIPTEIVAKVVEIPTNDAFNITRQLWHITSNDTEIAEIFASHSFLSWHRPNDGDDDVPNEEFLRTGKRQEQETTNGEDTPLHYLNELRKAIGK